LCEQALNVYEKVYDTGARHPEIARVYHMLALIHEKCLDFDAAVKFVEMANTIYVEKHVPQSPDRKKCSEDCNRIVIENLSKLTSSYENTRTSKL